MEIAPGIYSMTQRKGAYVHAFLLDDGDGLTLVDTLYDSDAHRILAELARIGKSVSDIKRIVMTHCHRSHLGGSGPAPGTERRAHLRPRVGGRHHQRRPRRPAGQ